MIDPRQTDVVMVPIEQITVVNPRARGRNKFRQIVDNIGKLGLKKPVTLARRESRDGTPRYHLVCGQGRLEAFQALGQTQVPALVIDATKEELLLMSLAENLARRHYTCLELLKEIGTLKERGYTYAQIAEKTDLGITYVRGILRLLQHGEARLLEAVERGQIPITIAVTIATSDDQAVQHALAQAYNDNSLRGKELLRARKIIEQRRNAGKGTGNGSKRTAADQPDGGAVARTYRREAAKQRALVQKAKVCETKLLFAVSALRQLFADDTLLALLRSTGLDVLPQQLLERVGRIGS